MEKGKYIIIIIFLLLVEVHLISQPSKPATANNFVAEVKLQYGQLWSHHLELDIFKAHFPAIEISLQKKTYGKHRWESEYYYPLLGINLWYSGIGGFDELGRAFAVYPSVNFPLVKNNDESLNFKLGVGVGYLTNKFDRLDNYKNFAIGSNINICASLFFEYRRRVSRMTTLTAGMGLTHFSNGSMKTPNYGLNIITGSIGVVSYLSHPNNSLNRKILPELYTYEFDGKKYLSFDISTAVAYKDMSEQYGESFYVYAFYTNLLARVSYKSKFGIGFDLTHDESDIVVLKNRNVEVKNNGEINKIGGNIAYELCMDRLSFLFNLGWYLKALDNSEGDVYQRLTLKYMISKKVFANMVLSAHLGKAEYVGFGIGWRTDFIYKRKIKHN